MTEKPIILVRIMWLPSERRLCMFARHYIILLLRSLYCRVSGFHVANPF